MTRKELVKQVSVETGVNVDVIDKVLLSVIRNIKYSLSDHEPIFIRGFATFKTVIRKQKVARDINKGTELIIPAHTKPVVKFVKSFLNELVS